MLEIDGLRAGYGKLGVLHGVTLRLEAGELVAVLGNNGVGKSSLLRAMIGLIPATAGRVRLADEDLTAWPSHKRVRAGIAYVPQGRGLVPRLTVRENLLVAAHGMAGAARAVEEALASFPALRGRGDDRAANLSGGQQQIVAVARSLVRRPRVLLLDEPSEGVAPAVLDEIGEHLRAANESLGLAILLVEQNVGFAANVAHRVCFMRRGEIVSEIEAEAGATLDPLAVENEFITTQV